MPIRKHFPPPLLLDDSRGVVTLLAILVVGAVGMTISVSALLFSISAAKTSLAEAESAQARGVANACAEIALHALQSNLNYSGNETRQIGNGTCTILPVINPGTPSPTINILGAVGLTKRKIQLIISSTQPSIQLASWKEVGDF